MGAAGPRRPRRRPGEADPVDIDLRRYALSALVDDLDGNPAPDEAYILLATAFREAGELVLLIQHRWLGSGKWLVRNLRATDNYGLLDRASGARSPRELANICRKVLDAAGGYLQEGFLRGERPSRQPPV
jgi:hypothetical protein